MNQSERTIRTVLDANELTPMDVVGVLCVTLVAGLTSGLWGVAAGVLVLAAATATTGPLAFVVAQLTAVSFFGDASLVALGGAQLAAFPLLASAACAWPPDRSRLARLAAGYVVALGAAWALWATLRWAWQATLVAVVLAALVAYGLHRYERVALGLVSTSDTGAGR
ncbi:hypothetical protein C5B90_11835 [Haloferax sp. Atlit-12N]|uniref:hypothetical protein n=1 Tax=Haloferax sp. Atlit-12N TaxID=2077203 RepID=UPI000E288CA5|nr:hypothetical protein [Haloferax sp. Atlit-12N]RDZ63811.1 hypothetical protein C5B90_11835 [Haloferax sp. Atlit-12N]